MKRFLLSESGDRGWFVGEFERSVLKTNAVEVAVQQNTAGEFSPAHYHKIATEVNLIVAGRVCYNKTEMLTAGQGIIFEPSDICECEYFEDTTTVVVKVPGPMADKYLI